MEVNKKNNFGVVRFFLALLVFVAHFLELGEIKDLSSIGQWANSVLAVQLFFVLSGYFSVSSFERTKSVADFFRKRFFRIYPAYAFVVVMAFLCFAFISDLGVKSYFASLASWQYLGANLLFANFLAPVLPGVFEHNFLPAINGSLWTLKIEVAYFLLVPAIMFLRNRLGKWPINFALIICAVFYAVLIEKIFDGNDVLLKQLPGQLHWFAFGLIAFDLRYKICEMKSWMYFAILVPCMVLQNWWPQAYLFVAVALLFGVGLKLPFVKFSDWLGNISYSFYLIHFPLIQLLVYLGLAGNDHGLSLLTALPALMMISYLIFRFIEEPLIHKSKNQISSGC